MAKKIFKEEKDMVEENGRNDLNVVGGSDEQQDKIHVVATIMEKGIFSDFVMSGEYIRVGFREDFITRLNKEYCADIYDIRLFRTSKEAKAYLEEIERELVERSEYGKVFLTDTGVETCQLLRVSDGMKDVLLDLRLFSRYESKREKLSVDDTTALVPVPLLRIDNGRVDFRRDECMEEIEDILDRLVCLYAYKEKQADVYGD